MNSIPNRSGFNSSFDEFIKKSQDEILGVLVRNQDGSVETTQREAWRFQINLLKDILPNFKKEIYYLNSKSQGLVKELTIY